ncbi:hypothetical protein PMM47T1_14120 [Pseudomonas sp. M47T1]|nr:hypothetical protein PMM47T1_14120 [Pseudomonas sp. M47T1]
MYKREGGELLGQLVQMESDDLKRIRLGKFYDNGMRYIWPREDYIEWIPLYRHPPAQARVVLPGRRQRGGNDFCDGLAIGWNDYDDELKRLNPTL